MYEELWEGKGKKGFTLADKVNQIVSADNAKGTQPKFTPEQEQALKDMGIDKPQPGVVAGDFVGFNSLYDGEAVVNIIAGSTINIPIKCQKTSKVSGAGTVATANTGYSKAPEKESEEKEISGHNELVADLEQLLADAKAHRFHDHKSTVDFPKTELHNRLLELDRKCKEGCYDDESEASSYSWVSAMRSTSINPSGGYKIGYDPLEDEPDPFPTP